jgi:hypothetical protein
MLLKTKDGSLTQVYAPLALTPSRSLTQAYLSHVYILFIFVSVYTWVNSVAPLVTPLD